VETVGQGKPLVLSHPRSATTAAIAKLSALVKEKLDVKAGDSTSPGE